MFCISVGLIHPSTHTTTEKLTLGLWIHLDAFAECACWTWRATFSLPSGTESQNLMVSCSAYFTTRQGMGWNWLYLCVLWNMWNLPTVTVVHSHMQTLSQAQACTGYIVCASSEVGSFLTCITEAETQLLVPQGRRLIPPLYLIMQEEETNFDVFIVETGNNRLAAAAKNGAAKFDSV